MRGDHGDQGDDAAQDDEEQNQVAARIFAALLGEAQVMNQDQFPEIQGGAVQGLDADMHRAAGKLQGRRIFRGEFVCHLARDTIGKARGLFDELSFVVAQADAHDPLIHDQAVEYALQLLSVETDDGVDNVIVDRVGDQLRTAVQVAHRPAQGKLIDQRNGQIGRGGDDQKQRCDETELQAKGVHGGVSVANKAFFGRKQILRKKLLSVLHRSVRFQARCHAERTGGCREVFRTPIEKRNESKVDYICTNLICHGCTNRRAKMRNIGLNGLSYSCEVPQRVRRKE